MSELVWYASYGSNLLRKRFLCYIKGGTLKGVQHSYGGCSDKTLPHDDRQIMIPHELYFAQSSNIWDGGGVAFIKSTKSTGRDTLGRMYLITREQFVDVVVQENALDRSENGETLEIDFERTIHDGETVIDANWYSRLLYLGTEDGYPILTFTGGWPDDEITLNAPGEKYLKVIIEGIQETYDLPVDGVVEYLLRLGGITGRPQKEALTSLVRSVYRVD